MLNNTSDINFQISPILYTTPVTPIYLPHISHYVHHTCNSHISPILYTTPVTPTYLPFLSHSVYYTCKSHMFPESLPCHAIMVGNGFFPNTSHPFGSLWKHSGVHCEEKWRKISLLDAFGSLHDPITRFCNRGKSHIWPCRIGRLEYDG